MHNSKEQKEHRNLKNYLDLLPVDPLARIVFHLPEATRRNSIAKMPEFKEALLKHDENLKNFSLQARALVKEDKDLKAASALVQKHSCLLTEKFCKAMVKWMDQKELSSKITQLAQFLHASAKEIDSTCTVGTLAGNVSETQRMDSEDEEDFDWTEERKDYRKVVWIKFGSVTVHYWFTPCCTVLGGEGTRVEGRVLLNIYKHVAANTFICGNVSCDWTELVEDYERTYYFGCSIRQYGPIKNSEINIVQGAAIGLAAGVGRWSPASVLKHVYPPNDDMVTMENIACAMQLAGRSFKSLTGGKCYFASDFMAVMC
jgi:hypothetical protein